MAAVMMAEAGWHPKREAKRFEPPPWERDRFEELKQQRAEEEAAVQAEPAAEAAEVEAAALAAEPRPAAAGTELETPAAVETGTPVEEAGARPAEKRPLESKPLPVSEAQFEAMLIQLSAEEPRVTEHLKPVGLFGAVIGMILGVSMFGWGLFAWISSRGQLAGVVGAMIVMGMGLLFATLGFMLGWRVTNDQGAR